jgi:protein SCO1/2
MSPKEVPCTSLALLLWACAGSASPATAAGLQDFALSPVAFTQADYVRSEHQYQIPDAILTDAYGKSISLAQELEADEPVMLNFIYTRCTTVCPAMSASFAEVQRQLGPEMRTMRLFSISIDPDYDTPTRLRTYAGQHRAGRGWMLLTGRDAEIVPVRKAFGSYNQDKSGHTPVTFLRAGAQGPWVRIDGPASASQLVAEYRRLQAR